MPVAKGSRLGPYEIAAAIGAGGMGEVYRAKDTRLERYVAVKIIHSNLPCTPEFKSRFEREARILSSLSHPHICSLYDVGKEGNLEFLVMELLDGETLSNRLRKGSLPVSAVVRLGIEIAEALAAAQRLGIIHRDLKPANIMLTASGAKLMDFGLAKPSIVDKTGAREIAEMATATMQNPSTPLSGANTLIGTIQYMAPEQIEGKGADERSDIFALGTVLYEAVTGRRAFEGKTNISVASAILQQDTPPIPDDPSDIGLPPLEYTIRTCMAKEPDQRFQLGWLSDSPASKNAYQITLRGTEALEALGVDVEAIRKLRRCLAYACVDWSERRPHIGGAVGAALLNVGLRRKWVIQELDCRALSVTKLGRREMLARFGLPD